MHGIADMRKRTELGFRQHSSRFAWRMVEAADHVLQRSLLYCMGRATYACLMLDGSCRPWLHHKEVASVMLRLVVDGELMLHFLGLPLLVDGRGQHADVQGYVTLLRDIFIDYPDLETICIGIVTDTMNVMSSSEGLGGSYSCPVKLSAGGSHTPSPRNPTSQAQGGLQQNAFGGRTEYALHTARRQ